MRRRGGPGTQCQYGSELVSWCPSVSLGGGCRLAARDGRTCQEPSPRLSICAPTKALSHLAKGGGAAAAAAACSPGRAVMAGQARASIGVQVAAQTVFSMFGNRAC